MKSTLFLFGFTILISSQLYAQHRNAHAHNDYEHKRPLFDALENGFTSFEADIHLINGELIVAHDYPTEIDTSRTLATLYLDPMLKLSTENSGRIYKGYPHQVYLLIDIKSEANETWQKLRKELENYEQILSRIGQERAIKIIISGNRPIDLILKETNPPAFLDGRPADLEKRIPSEKMPWISENYFKVIGSFNMGMPTDLQLIKIKTLVEKAHAENKKVRLWASPDKREIWEALLTCGVDFINADDLEGLQEFLTEHNKSH
jgi:hypothetical protein